MSLKEIILNSADKASFIEPAPVNPVGRQKEYGTLIIVLAAMMAIGPFSTDMYLPAFLAIAKGLETDIASVGLSLTSYFIGVAMGQIGYGPMLDRYGRKKPLMVGFLVYTVASLGCAFSPTIHVLVGMRFFAALGGCVGMVGSRAVVRDLFSGNEMARVLSLLMMVFGIAPIVAPTVGSIAVSVFGWRYIFLILAAISALVFVAINRFLPETKASDTSISLHPKKVMLEYVDVFKDHTFVTYALTAAAATAGFFSYITGSPFVYMKLLGFTETEFGWIYGGNVVGLILSNQFNRLLLRRHSGAHVVLTITVVQFCLAAALVAEVITGVAGKIGILVLIFGYLFCFGFIMANAVALALEPFSRNAGSASALIGSLQMLAGALASGVVSFLYNGTAMPMALVMATCTGITLALLCGSVFLAKSK